MSWKIIRRKFTALSYPRGSPQRYNLNKSSLTSEFARKKVWLVVDSQEKPLKAFETITEAKEFIENPSKYKPNKSIKKYTPQDMKRANFYSSIKRTSIKRSLGNY